MTTEIIRHRTCILLYPSSLRHSPLTCEPEGASPELLPQDLATLGAAHIVLLREHVRRHLLALEMATESELIFYLQMCILIAVDLSPGPRYVPGLSELKYATTHEMTH